MTDEKGFDPDKGNSNQQSSKKKETGEDKVSKSIGKIVASDQTPTYLASNEKPTNEREATEDPQGNRNTKDDKSSPAELFNAKPMPKMHAKKTKRNWIVPTVITLLVIIALLASGWTVYQQSIFEQNWAAQQSKIDARINQQSQVVEQAKVSGQASVQSANHTQLQLNQLAAKNQQLTDSLFSTQEKIKALSGRQKQDWMLAEAAYLIKIAQLQLSLQKDKQTAIQLLKTADRRITEIADNSLFPIREAIAKDLSVLSLILQPDVTGIALTLNAINQQIPGLSLLALQFEPLEKSLEKKPIEEQDFDLGRIYQNFLKDFVVIKDHSEPVKPLMTADQRMNLNSNIQLAIQQAQISLMQGNSSLYRLNIENATQWTEQFFKNDEKAKQVIAQLNNLKTKPVEVHYPNKLHSQKALDEISQQQLYHWLESSLAVPVPVTVPVSQTKIEASKKVDPQNTESDPQQNKNDQTDDLQQSDQQEQQQEGDQ